jgi:hypothetical protein
MRRWSRSARARALVGLSFVLLVLAGQLGTALHLSTVRHVRCAEHGELVHGAPAPDPGGASERDGPSGPTWRASQQDDAAQGHGHCCLATAKREWLAPDAAPRVLCRPAHADVSCPPGSERAHEQLARYALAPKQSPPA